MLIIPSKIHFVFLFSKSESICKKIRSIFNSSIVSFDKTFKDEYPLPKSSRDTEKPNFFTSKRIKQFKIFNNRTLQNL